MFPRGTENRRIDQAAKPNNMVSHIARNENVAFGAMELLFGEEDKSRIFARLATSGQHPRLTDAVIARGLLPSYCTRLPAPESSLKQRVDNSGGFHPRESICFGAQYKRGELRGGRGRPTGEVCRRAKRTSRGNLSKLSIMKLRSAVKATEGGARVRSRYSTPDVRFTDARRRDFGKRSQVF